MWENQGRWTVPKKKKVEKPQDGRQKSGQNIGNPYQMEDNKNPKGAALSTFLGFPSCVTHGCRMATVRAGSFVDAVRFSGPVQFAGPVRFARIAGSCGSPVRTGRPKSEIVMKMVAVRAVETPISAFCVGFPCESFRDNVVFQFFVENLVGSVRASLVRASSVRTGSWFMSVCASLVRAGSDLVVPVRFVATLLGMRPQATATSTQ